MAGTDGSVTLQDIEKEKTLAAKPDSNAQSSVGDKPVTSTGDNKEPVIPKGYIHKDKVDALLSDVKAETGRKVKTLEDQLTESRREAALVPGLQIQVNDLLGVKDDPNGKAAMLVKWNGDLVARESDLVKREGAVKGRESEVSKVNFNAMIQRVASEVKVSPDALMAKAAEVGITSEAGLKNLSVLIAEKAAANNDTSYTPDPLTGKSKGFDIRTATATEKIQEGLRRKAAGQK